VALTAADNVSPMQAESRPRKTLEGVERTVRILQVLRQHPETTLAEIARDVDLSEATVLRYLSSLTTFGFVERTPASRYHLGWEIFRLGQNVLDAQVPRAEALPVMEELLGHFNETVNLAYRKGDSVVIVEVLHGNRAIKKLNKPGQVDPWHASALGKALLSTMSARERQSLLSRTGLKAFTPNTIVDIDLLEADLSTSLERGYAIDREEAEEDLTCVGAAVPTPSGPSELALSVSFLSHRIKAADISKAGRAITAAAQRLGERLQST
jgi:DNA-binding IclR family transcriptional regulator